LCLARSDSTWCMAMVVRMRLDTCTYLCSDSVTSAPTHRLPHVFVLCSAVSLAPRALAQQAGVTLSGSSPATHRSIGDLHTSQCCTRDGTHNRNPTPCAHCTIGHFYQSFYQSVYQSNRPLLPTQRPAQPVTPRCKWTPEIVSIVICPNTLLSAPCFQHQ
jgi:hypothetical protein